MVSASGFRQPLPNNPNSRPSATLPSYVGRTANADWPLSGFRETASSVQQVALRIVCLDQIKRQLSSGPDTTGPDVNVRVWVARAVLS